MKTPFYFKCDDWLVYAWTDEDLSPVVVSFNFEMAEVWLDYPGRDMDDDAIRQIALPTLLVKWRSYLMGGAPAGVTVELCDRTLFDAGVPGQPPEPLDAELILDVPQGAGVFFAPAADPPPHDAATATGMYDRDC